MTVGRLPLWPRRLIAPAASRCRGLYALKDREGRHRRRHAIRERADAGLVSSSREHERRHASSVARALRSSPRSMWNPHGARHRRQPPCAAAYQAVVLRRGGNSTSKPHATPVASRNPDDHPLPDVGARRLRDLGCLCAPTAIETALRSFTLAHSTNVAQHRAKKNGVSPTRAIGVGLTAVNLAGLARHGHGRVQRALRLHRIGFDVCSIHSGRPT